MRDALLHDLNMLPNIEVMMTHDARLAPPSSASVAIYAQDNAILIWQNLLKNCDAAFIIAPETGGQLAGLVELVNRFNVLHLGSGLHAINVASSKYQTSQLLAKNGLNVVPTYYFYELFNNSCEDESQAWVIKPDDGAGCEGAIVFRKRVDVEQYISHQIRTLIIQPYIAGIPASISMLCLNGKASVLSCNLQKVVLVDSRFVYCGSIVNGLLVDYARLSIVAAQIAQAMPDLAGYVGVDVILSEGTITILEINPRLTTSYVGLHQSLGINPSKLILDSFFEPQLALTELYEPNNLNNLPVDITL